MSSALAQPDRILRELAELWVDLGRVRDESHAGVLRACALTLTVLIEESDDPADTGETLARLMRDHPSRAILIRVRPTAERVLSARVVAQCWMPFGKREQICCEQIEITASDAALDELPPVLLPLAAPDLPRFLWCRGPRLFRLPAFRAIAEVAGKVIVDSDDFDDSAEVLAALVRAPGAPRLADLAWTRLTRWRELIARIFENRGCLERLPGISLARVASKGLRAPADAYYLAAWLQAGLEKAGSRARLEFVHQRSEAPARVTGVELITGDAVSGRFSIAEVEGGAVEIRTGSVAGRAAFDAPRESALLGEELAICGPDPVFEQVLPRAAALAARL